MARTRAGSNLTISQLEQILASRRHVVSKLEHERAKLLKRLEGLEAQIAELGGDSRLSNGRVRNAKGLNDTIADVLASRGGGPVKVAEIVEAVLATGYKTHSANFRGIVNQSLIKDKRFVQAVRGAYQLKKIEKADKGKEAV